MNTAYPATGTLDTADEITLATLVDAKGHGIISAIKYSSMSNRMATFKIGNEMCDEHVDNKGTQDGSHMWSLLFALKRLCNAAAWEAKGLRWWDL